MDKMIFCGACAIMFLLNAGIGIFFIRRKAPANFWTGEKISPESVSDVKKFNVFLRELLEAMYDELPEPKKK